MSAPVCTRCGYRLRVGGDGWATCSDCGFLVSPKTLAGLQKQAEPFATGTTHVERTGLVVVHQGSLRAISTSSSSGSRTASPPRGSPKRSS